MPVSHKIPEKRRAEIIRYVREHKIIDVNFLMSAFNASRATITRDIKTLIGRGLVSRTCGGITSPESGIFEESGYSFDSSKNQFFKEKRAIACAAFSLLSDNHTIVLNPGVTTSEIAKLIAESDLQLNIITNSLKFYDLFIHDMRRKIILLGGELLHGGHMVSGKLGILNMNVMQGDLAIIGVHGIDLVGGLSFPYSEESELEAIMLKRCKKRIIVADHVKFGRICSYKVDFDLADIDVVITDEGLDKNVLAGFKNKGIHVIIAKN